MSAESVTGWVKPDILRALREMSGFQCKEVEEQARKLQRAHYAVVTCEQLEQWERGVSSPELKHLETLAEVYGCPVGHFFLQKVPQPVEPMSYRGLAPGKESRLSPLSRRTLRRFFNLSQWLTTLLEEHAILWEVKIRPVTTFTLEALVEQERRRLGDTEHGRLQWLSPDDAFAWWRQRIEAQGVFVFEMTMQPNEVRGASRWVDFKYPFILVNHQDAEASTGRLFTLLHEYAHLLTDYEGITCDFRGSGRVGLNQESVANRFAARMLLPQEEFRRHLADVGRLQYKENWSDTELDEIRRPFFVSRDVVVITLQDMHLAPPDLYQKKREQWDCRRPWFRTTTRRSLTKRERRARELGSSGVLVLLALQQNDALSLSDVASVLDMKVEKAVEFLEWARSELPINR